MNDSLSQLTTALSDRYAIQREIGSGGMATVYLAEDLRHERKVAIKVLRPELASELGPSRFLLEVKVTARLDHPHILPLLDSGEANGVLYYVMPLAEGESLRDRLNRETRLPIDDALQIAREVADAITYAHCQNVVHRDIKPENILLGAGHARVADFGIATAVSAAGGDRITGTGLAVGTAEYMSPEQAAGETGLDGRSDIYSLGCLLYEMLAGHPPFSGDTMASVVRQHFTVDATPITRVRAAVPKRVEDALTRSLAKEASNRYPTPSEFAKALAPDPVVASTRWQHPLAVAALFGVVSLVLLSAVYTLTMELGLPDWVIPGAIVLLLVGLPIMVATAIVQRGRGSKGGGIRRWLSWRRAMLGGVLAFCGLTAITAIYLSMRTLGIGPAGTLLSTGVLERGNRIILADFENRTDDSTLGPTITEALRVDLSQSRAVSLIDASVINEVLQRMESGPLGHLDVSAARGVAQREGGKAVVTGEIRPLGSGYVLLANLVSSADARILASVRETAAGEEQIIDALDRLSAGLRDHIGEPLKAIRASQSLGRVTTPSLEALRKFTQAEQLRDHGDEQGALTLLEEAVALDSAFAMAHRTIGIVVGNLGLSPRRNVTARSRAFQHRDRLTERERLLTMGTYYYGVTGELDEARAAYEAAVEAYPDEYRAWQNLGSVFRAQHQPLKAESCYIQAYRLGSSAISLVNLIQVQVGLGKFTDAKVTIETLGDRFPTATARMFRQRAVLAYGQRDYAGTSSHLQELSQVTEPLERARALEQIHAVHAIEGRLSEAGQYRSQAMDLFAQSGTAMDYLMATVSGAAIRVLLGQDLDGATFDVAAALRRFPLESLDPLERPYLDLALFYAVAGRTNEAKRLLGEWVEEIEPELRNRVKPSRHFVLGLIAFSDGRTADALLELQQALKATPAMYSQVVLPFLGRAYEVDGQADSAIASYEMYISRTEVGFGPTATSFLASAHNTDAAMRADALFRLGALNQQQSTLAAAKVYYEQFEDLWKNADLELQPRVEEVRRRIARLAGEAQEH